jgi:hypothetical protein
MSEMKDWRGTPIEVGSRVLYHGNSSWAVGVGTVTRTEERSRYLGYVWVDWQWHKGHNNKKSQPLLLESVTVLTKDLLDD